jgi:hypothetical protein
MGAPTSAILSEITLQWLEHNRSIKFLNKHHIIGYLRYVNDILVTYNSSVIKTENTLCEFYQLYPKLKFNVEKTTVR